MTVAQFVNKLKKERLLQPLINSGLMATKTMLYKDIHEQYSSLVKKEKVKPSDARLIIADKIGVCEMTVFNAVKAMEKKCQ